MGLREEVDAPDEADDEMLPEYDFSNAEVGKYAARYAAARRMPATEPDRTESPGEVDAEERKEAGGSGK